MTDSRPFDSFRKFGEDSGCFGTLVFFAMSFVAVSIGAIVWNEVGTEGVIFFGVVIWLFVTMLRKNR